MGAAESVVQEPAAQVTPSRPIENRHLLRVADPRSPTTGIPRTPIEVGDSPKRTPEPGQVEEEEVVEPTEIVDPRSPTHGIARTPLRPSLHASLNLLAKQLSEVFVSEESAMKGSAAAEAEPQAIGIAEQAAYEQPASPSAEVKEPEPETADSPIVYPEETPAQPAPPVLQPQKPRGKSPRKSGAKNVRHRPKKSLITTAPGRSPLKVLQEDNSPSTAVQHRQIKKLSLQPEPPASFRSVKISHNSWQMSHNKENAQYTQSES